MNTPATDIKSISREAVRIVREGDAAAAHRFICSQPHLPESHLAEALAVFNTAGLSEQQRQDMAVHLFPQRSISAAVCAQLGRYTFSFPQWRFLSQAFNGAALLEHYGMTRLKRETDLRNAALPDPARDEFGAGFCIQQDGFYIEYRRAYILCADEKSAVLIRNSSHYFGRDRLDAPVFVSNQPLDIAALQAIHSAAPQGFTAVRDAPAHRLSALPNLLAKLDGFDLGLSHWLGADGFSRLHEFLQTRSAPPYIAAMDASLPPWSPKAICAGMDTAMLKAFFKSYQADKIVLLSGRTGDVPAF